MHVIIELIHFNLCIGVYLLPIDNFVANTYIFFIVLFEPCYTLIKKTIMWMPKLNWLPQSSYLKVDGTCLPTDLGKIQILHTWINGKRRDNW